MWGIHVTKWWEILKEIFKTQGIIQKKIITHKPSPQKKYYNEDIWHYYQIQGKDAYWFCHKRFWKFRGGSDDITKYLCVISYFGGLPWWLSWWRICFQCRKPGFESWVGKIPWRREWQPTPVFWPGEFHGQSMESQWVGRSWVTFTLLIWHPPYIQIVLHQRLLCSSHRSSSVMPFAHSQLLTRKQKWPFPTSLSSQASTLISHQVLSVLPPKSFFVLSPCLTTA